MMGKLDQTLRFHETVLGLRAQRQQMIASNIANADTPNYKSRDIDFSKALESALGRNAASVLVPGMANTAIGHLSATQANATSGGVALLYRTPAQGNIDGNTVDMDAERNQFTDNALRYEASVAMISSQIKGLLSAIQGQ